MRRERRTGSGTSPPAIAAPAQAGAATTAEAVGSAAAPSPRASFGPTLALTVTLAFACFAVVMAVVMLLVDPTPIPPLGEQRQDAETALYLVAFAVILPLALVAVPRVADAIAAGPNAAALSPLAGLLAAGLGVAMLLVRLSDHFSWGGGMGVVLGAVGVWWAAAGFVLVAAARGGPLPFLARLVSAGRVSWAVAGGLGIATLLAVTHIGSLSALGLVLGGLAALAALVAMARLRLPRVPRRLGFAIDLAVVALLLLAVPDLIIFRPEAAAGDLSTAFETGIIQFHQDFLLGPANQLVHGGAMLVDTASQYGVGSIYLLDGWFRLAPIGYGTFGFLDGVLTALYFATGYCVLRLAGTPRLLAVVAMAVAVIALIYNLVYSVGALPQQGPLRFGLPMALVLAIVAGARWDRWARPARAGALLVLALSSIWAIEAFAFTAVTFAAIVCLEAWTLPAAGRLRWLGRQALLGAIACIGAHVVFALATLAGAGQLPDWGEYLAYLDAFLFGQLGDLTYDFSRWSPGLAVGGAYLASAATIVLLARREPGFVARERTALVALTGTTASGIALFSYFVNRSSDHILPYVSLPALLATALWLALLLRSRDEVRWSTRIGALAFALSVGVLLVAVAWTSVGPRFERSALDHALPGGKSLRAAIDRLWHPPPLDPRAPGGEQLIDRYMPGQSRTPVLLSPDLAIEILIRSQRANQLPFGDPWEDSFVSAERLPELREAIAELRAGDRMLIDSSVLGARASLEAQPSEADLTRIVASRSLARLQLEALRRIGARFRLRPIRRSSQGLIVVELDPRRSVQPG